MSYGQLVDVFEEIASKTTPSRSTRSSASGPSAEEAIVFGVRLA